MDFIVGTIRKIGMLIASIFSASAEVFIFLFFVFAPYTFSIVFS